MEVLPSSVKEKAKNALDSFREEGLQEGLRKGVQKQTEKVVRNLVRGSGLTDEQIAEMAEVAADYVAKIRKEMRTGDGG